MNMRVFLITALILCECTALSAQTKFGDGLAYPDVVYASLPAAASSDGKHFRVTDCLTSACTAGGGSIKMDVASNGSAWVTIGSGSGTGCIPAGTSGQVLTDDGAGGCTAITTTGTGSGVKATSPTLVTPALGTPSSIVLTNATGFPTLNQSTSGNAATATALSANPANCSAGQFPLGVDASGVSETCTALPTTIAGTANEITASAATGPVTLSLPSLVSLASKGLLLPSSTTLPGTCSVGQIYMDTNATTGQRLYACETTNTWVLQGGAGSGVTSVGGLNGAVGVASGIQVSGSNIQFDSAVLSGVYAAWAGNNNFGVSNTFTPSTSTGSVILTPTARPSAAAVGTVNIDLSGNLEWVSASGPTWAAAGGAPVGATYIVQTANGTLTAEQALSSLSTGLMKVTTTTGAITSVVPGTGVETWVVTPSSANLAAAVTGETGSGALVFGTAPTINGLTFPTAGGGAVVSQTIASGSTAVDFASTATGTCATVITATATGTASTDVISFTPNASIKAVTGYVPASTGGMSIAAYPTTNTVNFEGCNWTAGTVDAGSITLNWRVTR